MALFIGVFIVVLVLFMVVAMALAEWADLDIGDLLTFRRPGKAAETAANAPTPAPGPETMTPAAMASPLPVKGRGSAVAATRVRRPGKTRASRPSHSAKQRKPK